MKIRQMLLTLLLVSWVSAPLLAAPPPPLPETAPVLLVGSPSIVAGSVSHHQATFSMGRAGKDGPLALGEKITAGALQESVLEETTTERGAVLRRTNRVRRPGSDQVLAEASIEMDPKTLLPLVATTTQGGQTSTLEYDWTNFTIRQTPGADGSESTSMQLDFEMLEVGAHDVWMAALPLREDFTARLPAVFASTGTKYWAVPRVVGSERIDIGHGGKHDAWVVELDWWGMGAANTVDNHSKGGGVNDTAGAGGKYWVLKKPVDGTPRVVRVRTEIDAQADSVIQLQGS